LVIQDLALQELRKEQSLPNCELRTPNSEQQKPQIQKSKIALQS